MQCVLSMGISARLPQATFILPLRNLANFGFLSSGTPAHHTPTTSYANHLVPEGRLSNFEPLVYSYFCCSKYLYDSFASLSVRSTVMALIGSQQNNCDNWIFFIGQQSRNTEFPSDRWFPPTYRKCCYFLNLIYSVLLVIFGWGKQWNSYTIVSIIVWHMIQSSSLYIEVCGLLILLSGVVLLLRNDAFYSCSSSSVMIIMTIITTFSVVITSNQKIAISM